MKNNGCRKSELISCSFWFLLAQETLLIASVPLKFFSIVFPVWFPSVWSSSYMCQLRGVFFPKMALLFEARLCHVTWAVTFSSNILWVLYYVWGYSHHFTGRRNANLGIISNFLTEFVITLWKHSHVMSVDEYDQDECGPFSPCRKEGSWGRLAIATLWAF